jgi:hypothetical protein
MAEHWLKIAYSLAAFFEARAGFGKNRCNLCGRFDESGEEFRGAASGTSSTAIRARSAPTSGAKGRSRRGLILNTSSALTKAGAGIVKWSPILWTAARGRRRSRGHLVGPRGLLRHPTQGSGWNGHFRSRKAVIRVGAAPRLRPSGWQTPPGQIRGCSPAGVRQIWSLGDAMDSWAWSDWVVGSVLWSESGSESLVFVPRTLFDG